MAGEHVIDIEKLAVSLTVKRNNGCLSSESGKQEIGRLQIHRIKVHIRDRYKNAFQPLMLSIGPYNHRVPGTHAMQMTKYEFLDYILNLNQKKNIADYLDAMKGIEEQVRRCYADEVNMDRIDFLKMLLLDGCFMLVALHGIDGSMPKLQESEESNRAGDISTCKDNSRSVMNDVLSSDETNIQTNQHYAMNEDYQEDSCPTDKLYSQYQWHDFLLLENQIPFFVITKIHNVMVDGSKSTTTSELVENINGLVEIALCCYPKTISKSNRPKEFYHLLHLCHMYFRPCPTKVEGCENNGKESSSWRRATEYHRAGIIFKKRKFCYENPHSLLDIVFDNSVIEMPSLTIDPNTKSLFCNLIAFEQTCPQFENYITSYIIFLSRLISLPEDVSLLTKRGIIVHRLNSDDEVSVLFRVISECAVIGINSDNYLKPLCNKIEEHYQTRKPMIKELLGSITSNIHRWTQTSESSGLPMTSQEIPI